MIGLGSDKKYEWRRRRWCYANFAPHLSTQGDVTAPQISRRAKSLDARIREVTPGQICGVAETCINRSLYVKIRISNNCLDLFTVSVFFEQLAIYILKYFLIQPAREARGTKGPAR